MSVALFFLVLAAAFLHAGWNAVVKASPDRLISTWAIMTTGGFVSVPFLIVLRFPPPTVWWLLAASVVIHVGYVMALATAYERANLSVAYPIARGSAPLIIAIGGVIFLDDALTPQGFLGVGLMTLGLVSLATTKAFVDIRWAIATGLFIALYTLVDAAGVRETGSAVRYIAAVFVLQALIVTSIVLRLRKWSLITQSVGSQPWRLLLGGAASATAYILVMIAARTEPVGLVSGIRETSVLFGLFLGKRILRERVSQRQAVSVGLAVIGAFAIAIA